MSAHSSRHPSVARTDRNSVAIQIDDLPEDDTDVSADYGVANFPAAPRSVDDLLQASKSKKQSKLIRKVSNNSEIPPHSRSATTEPIVHSTIDEPIPELPSNHQRRGTLTKSIRSSFTHKNIRGVTYDMPLKMMQKMKPTQIPFIQRALVRWPGHPKYKTLFHSPYFFLYIISMSLVQAFLSGIIAFDTMIADGWSLGTVVSLTFFVLYIIEVMVRIWIKGFEFFLIVYNIAELCLTLTAFILDFRLEGSTSFVANVLSLRIIWCIHKVPGMTFIIEGIRLAAPRMSIILFPLLILTYVFAVIATSVLGPQSYQYPSDDYWLPQYNYTCPNGTIITVDGGNLGFDYFGNIPKSMFTLFQVMTGDAWASNIARPTMTLRPWSFILFILFYSLFAFVLLNIFTGIMVNAIQSYEEEQHKQAKLQRHSKKGDDDDKSDKSDVSDTDMRERSKSLESLRCQSIDYQISPKNPIADYQIKKSAYIDDSTEPLKTVTSSSETLQFNSLVIAPLLHEIQMLRDEMIRNQSKLMNKIALLETKLESS